MGSNLRRLKRHRFEIAVICLVALALIGLLGFFLPRLGSPPTVEVHFQSAGGNATPSFELWVADNPQSREKGLMFVKPDQMPRNGGMIFVYPESQNNTFWMRNTYLPLDMLFVDKELQVVGVLHNVPILNDQPRSVGKPSKYVIELHAGTASRHGIAEGAKMIIKGEMPKGT